MPICLNVAPYCEECEGFEARVTRNKMASLDGNSSYTETYIRCEHSKKCARMYQQLKKFVEKEKGGVVSGGNT